MGTGMGIPSASIYAKELITEYNVKEFNKGLEAVGQ